MDRASDGMTSQKMLVAKEDTLSTSLLAITDFESLSRKARLLMLIAGASPFTVYHLPC